MMVRGIENYLAKKRWVSLIIDVCFLRTRSTCLTWILAK